MLGALAQRVIQTTTKGLAGSIKKLPAAIGPRVSSHASKHSIKIAGESLTQGAKQANGLFNQILKPFYGLKTLFQKTFQMARHFLTRLFNTGQKLFKNS